MVRGMVCLTFLVSLSPQVVLRPVPLALLAGWLSAWTPFSFMWNIASSYSLFIIVIHLAILIASILLYHHHHRDHLCILNHHHHHLNTVLKDHRKVSILFYFPTILLPQFPSSCLLSYWSLYSTCLNHLSFGHPMGLLPFSFKSNAPLNILVLSSLSTWPNHWSNVSHKSVNR